MSEISLIILASIIIGLSLGLLGSGGSILTVPALTYIIGQDEKTAIASSLAIVGLIALSGSLKYYHDKKIYWPVVLQLGLPSMLGSYIAAGFSVYLSGNQQILLFSVIMILAAFSMLTKQPSLSPKSIKNTFSIKLIVIGGILGGISGLIGVGGGFLIVPALLAFTTISMVKAVATSLVIITLQSLTGFIKYYSIAAQQDLTFDWHIIVTITLIGSISSFLGQKISANIPQESLKKIFALMLIIMGISIFITSSNTLF